MRLPLESTISMCRILISWAKNAQIIEVVNAIMSASKILLCRMNDLLDLSTLEKGTFSKTEKVFDLLQSV